MDPITVLIVDDHTVAREGLRAMLGTDEQIQVVGEAADGEEALAKVAELHPRVVLIDIRIPQLDGLEVTRRIKAIDQAVAVIVVTSYDDDGLVVGAVRAGASGYLLKDASRDLLIHTIGAAASGGLLIKAALLRRAISGLVPADHYATNPLAHQGLIDDLTEREQHVLNLLAEGRTNKEIADILSLAEVTVKKHVQAIIAKLHTSDRTGAAVKGLRIGLVK